ncbi:MAG TPA: thiamine pyrophosphate-dependent dehydrogenase E1 component subunit alpha [Aeromicrobium sp.]|nr:thiamine pyrophosphate-dependent dehydrogenase E1 component subunit alpha [Aeromicrobium sp.]
MSESGTGGTHASLGPASSVQLLTPEGVRQAHPEFSYDGDLDAVAALYRQMFLVRRIDNEAFALQRHGELGLWPPALGQEAAQVGSAAALDPADFVYPSYRETLVGWLLGIDLADLIAMWRCSTLGGWDAIRHRFGPLSIVIGSQPLHAVGYARGMVMRGDANPAVLTYFGDGASSQGDVWEALEFAALQNAPVVFFCQNNQYAISLPVAQQTAAPIVQRAQAFGMRGIHVDGNDVLACQAVTTAALDHVRSGDGPVLIEALTYRMGPHTTSDDATRYRDVAEVEAWRDLDPLDRVKKHLEAEGFDSQFFADLDAEAEALGASVRATCLAIPEPDLAAWFDNVYAEQTDELRAQQAEYVAWRDQYGGVA